MPRKVFTAGEVLAAADVNSFLMDQTVMTFAGTAARGSAIGTATEGMVTYLNDIDALSVHNGTQFVTNRPIMTFAGTAARGSAIPSPVDGMTTYLQDLDRYDSYSGAAWVPVVSTGAWTSYTPTTSNLTLGNGTITAEYNVVGKTIFLAIRFVLGSTSAISGSPTFTLPSGFTSAPLSTFSPVGTGLATISSTSYILTTVAISSNRVAAVVNNASGTYASGTDMSSTIPATWVTGSIYEINAIVEIA